TQSQAEGILRSTALHLPDSPSFYQTGLGTPVLPWDIRATGAGLVQGAAAVAATPSSATNAAATIAAARAPGAPSSDARVLRVVSRPGALPVLLEWSALAAGVSAGKVFDAQGRVVRQWRSDVTRAARVAWDGRDDAGALVRGGVYFVRLEAAGRIAAAQLVVMPE